MARKLASDKILFAAFVALALLGCVMIYSASALEAARIWGNPYRYLLKQLIALTLGFAVAFAVSRVDAAFLRRPWVVYAGLGTCLFLCAVVLFRPPINAARRWLVFGRFTLQPAEFLKVALVLFLAYQIDRKRDRLDDFLQGILPTALFLAIATALVLAEPDLGTATSYVLVAASLLFLAGAPLRYFAIGAAAFFPVLAILMVSASYRRQRIFSFFHPEADPLGKGFQAAQSLIAVGTGGWTGNGLGQSRQKLFFLPYPHTDFIYAIVGEELGFFGAVAVVALFGIIAWRGLRVARRAPEPYLAYLAVGATAMIVLQAAINIGVVLTLLPTKGIPLPFLSYGGSSLVADCVAAGLLLNVSQHVT
jgi:cell division protein FtsW